MSFSVTVIVDGVDPSATTLRATAETVEAEAETLKGVGVVDPAAVPGT